MSTLKCSYFNYCTNQLLATSHYHFFAILTTYLLFIRPERPKIFSTRNFSKARYHWNELYFGIPFAYHHLTQRSLEAKLSGGLLARLKIPEIISGRFTPSVNPLSALLQRVVPIVPHNIRQTHRTRLFQPLRASWNENHQARFKTEDAKLTLGSYDRCVGVLTPIAREWRCSSLFKTYHLWWRVSAQQTGLLRLAKRRRRGRLQLSCWMFNEAFKGSAKRSPFIRPFA